MQKTYLYSVICCFSWHNSVDIKIGHNLQSLHFLPILLDFVQFLVYSIQANHFLGILCILCYVCCLSHLSFAFSFYGGASFVTIASSCTMKLFLRHKHVVLLFTFWITGLLLGCSFAGSFSPHCVSLMLCAVYQPLSIVGLLSCSFFPFLLICFSLYSDSFTVLYLLFFFKAVSFGFTGMLLCFTFGSAAWLIGILIMFSNVTSTFLLFFFSMRRYGPQIGVRKHELVCCFICLFLIALIDYFAVEPFLRGLF